MQTVQSRATADAGWAFELPTLPARLAQIDLLKGLAILSVIALHTLTAAQLTDYGARFWIGQAVPVFVVLMGLNATASFWRYGTAGPRTLYSRRYVLSRIDRLYVPFLIVFLASLVLAAARGSLNAGLIIGAPVTGHLAYSGPGNYYIGFVIQFAVLFPLMYWAYRRARVAVIIGSFLVAALVEFAAPHLAVLSDTYFFESFFLRFMPYVVLGVILAERMLHGEGLPRWWWPASAISIAYLCAVTIDSSILNISIPGLRVSGQTFLGAFYAGLLVALGLHWLPRTTSGPLSRALAAIGVASYEIFLVQIFWFPLVTPNGVAMFVPSAVACCAIGYGLHLAIRRLPQLAERSVPARS